LVFIFKLRFPVSLFRLSFPLNLYCLELAGATVLAAKILRVGAEAYRVEPPELVMVRLGGWQPFRQERDQPARVNAEAAGDFGLWRNNAPSRRILPSAVTIFLA